jgi:Tol biopolymer transport system component
LNSGQAAKLDKPIAKAKCRPLPLEPVETLAYVSDCKSDSSRKMTNQHDQHNPPAREDPLQGWKEIAAHLGRDARTAQRWEEYAGLPVRRHHSSASSVYAYPSEIESWRASRGTKSGGDAASTPSSQQPRRILIPALAATGLIAVVLLVVGFGPVLNPPSPIAQAAEDGLRTELVWPRAKGNIALGSVSPDGKFVTYVDWGDEGNLAIQNLETGENRRLTDTATAVTSSVAAYAMLSSISPDGKQVVYQWNRPNPASPVSETGELRWLSLDDAQSEPRTIWSPAEGSYVNPNDWFPDSDRVAAVLTSSRTEHQIVTVSVPDGDVRQIRSIDWSDRPLVRVSPDGRHIAYSRSASREQPAKDIFMLAVDGSSESTVIEHAANDELVGWSPKGDYLIINSDRGGKPGLWLQPLENAKPVGQLQLIVPNVDVAAGMGFTTDGSLYYHVRVSRERLKIAAIDMRTGKFLTKPKNAVERFVGLNIQGPFSPDGEEFAYRSRREGWSDRAIVVRSLATGEEREVPRVIPGEGITFETDR